MSRALMALLGRPKEKMLEITFTELEKATGKQAIDARIVGDILHIAHLIIRDIGLESDVTAKELYQALRVHDDILSADTRYVGLIIGGQVVSFHPDDIAQDGSEMARFETRSLTHLYGALAEEISRRYTEWAAHPDLLSPIIRQLQKKEKV